MMVWKPSSKRKLQTGVCELAVIKKAFCCEKKRPIIAAKKTFSIKSETNPRVQQKTNAVRQQAATCERSPCN